MNDLGPLFFILAVCGLVMFGAVECEDSRQRSECAKMHQITGLETRYPDELNFDQGCYVRLRSGQWIPAKYWRGE